MKEINKEELDIFARTLYGEAEANNFADVRAIANVIMNRVKEKQWPNTISKVCMQPWQFSCHNPNDKGRDRISHASGYWWDMCQEVAYEAMTGDLLDKTNQSTHYYATYVKKPKWAKGHMPVYEVPHKNGHSHIFFNDIDTPAPKTAKETLDQQKPLATTRTAQGATLAAGGATLGIVAEAVNQIQPAFGLLGTIAQYAPMALMALVLAGIAYVVFARWDDRRRGLR
jgi:hypothetical protein